MLVAIFKVNKSSSNRLIFTNLLNSEGAIVDTLFASLVLLVAAMQLEIRVLTALNPTATISSDNRYDSKRS